MKKIFLFTLSVLALGFAGCVEDKPYSGFANMTQSPTSVSPDDAVTVTATTINVTDTPSLVYIVNGGTQTTVDMTSNNGVYSATIPAQADKSVVIYWLVAGDAKSDIKTYTVSALVIEVVINEANGSGADADKFIELYNNGDEELSLAGFTLTYNGNNTWTGAATHKIAGKGFFVLQGSKGGDFSTGLSSASPILLILKAPNGSEIDRLEKLVETAGQLSMERIPNGTGDFYYTTLAGTKGITNATDTSGGKVQ